MSEMMVSNKWGANISVVELVLSASYHYQCYVYIIVMNTVINMGGTIIINNITVAFMAPNGYYHSSCL